MNNSAAIGIFDSGVGGTSIWKEIHELLPSEKTIYLADSRNAPYGEKPVSEIIRLSKKNTEKLLDMGVKMVVVACNTATTNAIDILRATYNIPFIGIEPAIKPAALNSKSGAIGILATRGTLTSQLFHKAAELYSRNLEIVEVEGRGLVDLIERGLENSPEMHNLLRELLEPMLQKHIDHLVLGCSHYPYLIPALKEILPQEVKIIDSGEAVAKQTRAILEKNKLLAFTSTENPKPVFFTNTKPDVLAGLIDAATNQFEVSYLDF